MKPIFILLLLFGFLEASSQASPPADSRLFYSQLMVVFSDLDKHFEFLKGDLDVVEGTDTLYETNHHLEGTRENNILISSDQLAYQAMISDSVTGAGSQYLMKAWKDKLTGALSDSFKELGKEFHSENDPSIDGYLYASGKISVLLLRHKTKDDTYWINLVIKTN